MKKRTVIKIVSFMGAFIVVISGFYFQERAKSMRYSNIIQTNYSQAFEQLNSSLNIITSALTKTVYADSAKLITSCAAQIFSEAELAKSALSKIPCGQEGLTTVYKFLSQAGNYALAVSKSVISGNDVTSKQREELKTLVDTAVVVSQVVSDSDISFNNAEYWAETVENEINNSVNEESLAASLTELEENLADYPTLIYDGPYSDHILEKQPLMVSNAKYFSQSEALEVAKKIADEDSDLQFDGEQGGKIECYRFVSKNTSVAITKKGGYVFYMRKSREIGENILSYEQALSKAENFLETNEISNMIDTYYYTDGGVCVINFAYLDGQTVCYTDLIKVGVAMDTGEIMLLETGGYLTNHTDRAFEAPSHTSQEAAECVNEELEIEETTMTLIPTDNGGELRCYEFLCRTETGEEILVYINISTLEDEQIYILLKTDGGMLVK